MTITLSTILVIALTTIVTRALPFFLFPAHKQTPAYILYLGKVLPYAITGMLIVYCLKDVSFADVALFLPQLIAVAVVVALHLWRRNTLLSIAVGTVLYMLLVQFVF